MFTLYDEAAIETACNDIKKSFKHCQKRIEYLEQENDRMRSETYAQDELAKMKKDCEIMRAACRRGFPISEKDSEKIHAWQEQHTEKIHKATTPEQKLQLEGISGGRWTYEFIPTSIGTIAKCVCSSCRNKAVQTAGDPGKYKTYDEYRKRRRELINSYDAEFEFGDFG